MKYSIRVNFDEILEDYLDQMEMDYEHYYPIEIRRIHELIVYHILDHHFNLVDGGVDYAEYASIDLEWRVLSYCIDKWVHEGTFYRDHKFMMTYHAFTNIIYRNGNVIVELED